MKKFNSDDVVVILNPYMNLDGKQILNGGDICVIKDYYAVGEGRVTIKGIICLFHSNRFMLLSDYRRNKIMKIKEIINEKMDKCI